MEDVLRDEDLSKDFFKELKKGNKNKIKTLNPRRYPLQVDLLEDMFTFKNNKIDCLVNHNGFSFSLRFIDTLKGIETDEKFYIVDGEQLFFNHLGVPGVRSRGLRQILYGLSTDSVDKRVLEDNPWLFTKFGYYDKASTAKIQEAFVEFRHTLLGRCTKEVHKDLMPLGEWGLLFLLKLNRWQNLDPRSENFVITLDELRERIANESCRRDQLLRREVSNY